MTFAEDVATRSSCPLQEVESVLADFGIQPQPTPAAPVDLTITHLRFSGTKTGEDHANEEFEFDRQFAPGLWAVISEKRNLVGKSSVLLVIRWALTGRSHLSGEVRSWVRHVELEGTVGGEPFTIAFDVDGPAIQGSLKNGHASEDFDAASFEEVMDGFFLDRLRLQPMPSWQKRAGESEEGDRRRFGWPSYFPALHLHPDGGNVLLGDQVEGGQATALMQVFLGLPWSHTAASARVAFNELQMREAARRRRVEEDQRARDDALAPVREKLATAERELSRLAADHSRISAEEGDSRVESHAAAVAAMRVAEEELSVARRAEAETRRDADDAQKRVDAIVQTRVVRPLLGRLSPTSCPRCYAVIGEERIARETEHHCSVCDEALADLESDGTELTEAEQALKEANEQCVAAGEAVAAAQATHDEARLAFDSAGSAVREVEDSRPGERRLHELEKEIARLEGSLEPVGVATEAELSDSDLTKKIVKAARDEALRRRSAAADTLLADLGTEIADLARAFGMPNLEAATPKLNAQLQLRVAGVNSPFGKRTAGERLRLRLATVIALLRIGSRQGVGRHPGLLLIDSPGAEEMVDENVGSILGELSAVCNELQDLQLICATARAHEAKDAIESDKLIHGPDYDEVW